MKFSKHIELLIKLLLYQKYYLGTKKLLNSKKFYSKEDIEQYQFNKLKEIIKYSYENVPYYYELFNKINFNKDNLH